MELFYDLHLYLLVRHLTLTGDNNSNDPYSSRTTLPT